MNPTAYLSRRASRAIIIAIALSSLWASATLVATAQTPIEIHGVINAYAKVLGFGRNCEDTSGYDTEIVVDNASPLLRIDSLGPPLIIMQMKGSQMVATNDSAFGDRNTSIPTVPTGVGDDYTAGQYEVATIQHIYGNTIHLSGPLTRHYRASNSVQVIAMRIYNGQVSVVSPGLTCLPWNGNTGGVLAFECLPKTSMPASDGILRLYADIDVSGKGFRGGDVSNNYDTSTVSKNGYYYSKGSGIGGGKGEGALNTADPYLNGRGKLRNGGGGGNAIIAGGGGGGNGGNGGLGSSDILTTSGTHHGGGVGGASFYYGDSNRVNQRVILGGGGGGGHQINNSGVAGAPGGGIVILVADKLYGRGYSILANGSNAEMLQSDSVPHAARPLGDGGGGGGAGGVICLALYQYADSTDTLTLTAKGGKGSDIWINSSTGSYGAPGGGGGGGVIWSQTSIPVWVNTIVSAGAAGGCTGCMLTPNASAGQIGVVPMPIYPWHFP